MKKLFTTTLLSIVMLLICAPGAAASDRAIAYHDLPLRAQSFVKKYFNPHKVVLVKEDRGFGEWTEVKCPKGLKNGIIPVQIMNFMKHRGYLKHGVKPVKIEYSRKGYEVKLSNGTELEFDNRFNLVDVDH